MKPAQIPPSEAKDESLPTKYPHRKYALLLTPLVVLALLALGLSYFLKSDTPAPSSAPPPVASQTNLNPPEVKLALFAKGLPNTTAIISREGDNRLFVLDQDGLIRIVNSDGSVVAKPFLDIRSKVLFRGEMGLLGMAFSPNYQTDGYFFINYVDNSQRTVVARYHASSSNSADSDSEQKILTIGQPYANHNGGAVVFGPDGYLYVALGDGGSRGDPQNRAQDLSSLFGKILRLDVSQLPYKIPSDNPFTNQEGKRGEIWDWGLRNPWRISFDRQTGDFFIADVGQGKVEEIDFALAGSQGGNNWGWRCYEGSEVFNLNGCGDMDAYIFPVIEYDHSEKRCSVTGGYVYRGKKYPARDGIYWYGDFCGGQLYGAKHQLDPKHQSSQWPVVQALNSGYKISTFGEDAQGELYLADYGTGNIYRIQDTAN